MSTNCPTYAEILVLFPDQSNQDISGAFEYSNNGFYERQSTVVKHHLRYYHFETSPMLWIDPPSDVLGVGKRIVIAPSNFDYPIRDQEITNSSFKIGQNRYVSENCVHAIISAQNFFFLLGDTLNYLTHDCDPEYTNFDEVRIQKWNATNHDITQSAKWKLQQYIKNQTQSNYDKLVKSSYDPLAAWQEYERIVHVGSTSDMMKHRNAIAGAMNYNE